MAGNTRSLRFPRFPKWKTKPAPGVFLASKDDTTQTFFHVGELGGELRDKDYPALEVAADILGGGFSSRLFQSVRTKHGWAYNISARSGPPITIIPALSKSPAARNRRTPWIR